MYTLLLESLHQYLLLPAVHERVLLLVCLAALVASAGRGRALALYGLTRSLYWMLLPQTQKQLPQSKADLPAYIF